MRLGALTRRRACSSSSEKGAYPKENVSFGEDEEEGSPLRMADSNEREIAPVDEDDSQPSEGQRGERYYMLDDFSDWDPEDDEESVRRNIVLRFRIFYFFFFFLLLISPYV